MLSYPRMYITCHTKCYCLFGNDSGPTRGGRQQWYPDSVTRGHYGGEGQGEGWEEDVPRDRSHAAYTALPTAAVWEPQPGPAGELTSDFELNVILVYTLQTLLSIYRPRHIYIFTLLGGGETFTTLLIRISRDTRSISGWSGFRMTWYVTPHPT